jgi:Icc protein
VLPLPGENVFERLFSWVGWPFADELDAGTALLQAIAGRGDLILHGHRHQPVTVALHQDQARPLQVCNAGSSTALGGVRVFTHRAGRVMGMPGWLFVGGGPESSERLPASKTEPAQVLVPELR